LVLIAIVKSLKTLFKRVSAQI